MVAVPRFPETQSSGLAGSEVSRVKAADPIPCLTALVCLTSPWPEDSFLISF